MKKLPADWIGREIFSEKSGQLVHLQSHAALLPGSGILVQDTLGDGLVNSLNGLLVGTLSNGLVTAGDGSLKLLDDGLQLGLVSLVLLVSNLGRQDILLRGLDIGLCVTPPMPLFHTVSHYNATFQ